MVLWRPTRPSRTLVLDSISPPKRYPFHHGDWNANLGSQEIPGIAGEFDLGAQNEAGQKQTEFCQENVLVRANTLSQQNEKRLPMNIIRWSVPKSDWLYSLQPKMEKLYTVSKIKTGSWLWLRSWTTYCQIQTEIEKSGENQYDIQIWPKSNPLWLYSGSEK